MIRYATGLLWIAALSACATGSGRLGRAPEQPVRFPTAPDTARVQFLFAITTEADVRGERGGLFASVFDETGEGAAIVKPYGVDYHDGVIYVCDTMLPGLEIIDVRTQTFERWVPAGDGTLRKPINCAVDSADGRVYVTDTEREQIVVFDADRNYLGAFGGEDGIVPVDIAIDGDRVWAVGLRRHGVRAYDKRTWQTLETFPEASVPLRQPVNVAARDGRVFVSDLGDFNVKIFDREGGLLRTLGSYGANLGQFSRPKGIDVDAEGRMYVVDAGFQNVQIFNPDGELLLFFGGGYSGPGTMWLPAKVRIVDRDLEMFRPYVMAGYDLQHIMLVTNQYGPDRLSVYGLVSPRHEGN